MLWLGSLVKGGNIGVGMIFLIVFPHDPFIILLQNPPIPYSSYQGPCTRGAKLSGVAQLVQPEKELRANAQQILGSFPRSYRVPGWTSPTWQLQLSSRFYQRAEELVEGGPSTISPHPKP